MQQKTVKKMSDFVVQYLTMASILVTVVELDVVSTLI